MHYSTKKADLFMKHYKKTVLISFSEALTWGTFTLYLVVKHFLDHRAFITFICHAHFFLIIAGRRIAQGRPHLLRRTGGSTAGHNSSFKRCSLKLKKPGDRKSRARSSTFAEDEEEGGENLAVLLGMGTESCAHAKCPKNGWSRPFTLDLQQ